MKIKDLRVKQRGELEKLLEEKKVRLQTLRFSMVRGEVKNCKEIGEQKKDIARIFTLLIESIEEKPQS